MKCLNVVFFIFLLVSQGFGQVEICNNGIDDDNDGLTNCDTVTTINKN